MGLFPSFSFHPLFSSSVFIISPFGALDLFWSPKGIHLLLLPSCPHNFVHNFNFTFSFHPSKRQKAKPPVNLEFGITNSIQRFCTESKKPERCCRILHCMWIYCGCACYAIYKHSHSPAKLGLSRLDYNIFKIFSCV